MMTLPDLDVDLAMAIVSEGFCPLDEAPLTPVAIVRKVDGWSNNVFSGQCRECGNHWRVITDDDGEPVLCRLLRSSEVFDT